VSGSLNVEPGISSCLALVLDETEALIGQTIIQRRADNVYARALNPGRFLLVDGRAVKDGNHENGAN
jgi:hypothetical protein